MEYRDSLISFQLLKNQNTGIKNRVNSPFSRTFGPNLSG